MLPFKLGVLLVTALVVDRLNGEYVHHLSDEYIKELNQLGLPWKAGRNFQANLTKADVTRMFGSQPLGLPESPKSTEGRKKYEATSLADIPKEFDARKHFKSCSSIIGVIPDQGACASSYAFAITSVASDRLCIHTNGKIKKLLSAEYVTSCCKRCRWPSSEVCSSGLSSYTWNFVHRRGLVTGGGYESHDGCQPVSFPNCNHSPNQTSLPFCIKLETPKPKCHTRCTNKKYPKDFFHDKTKFTKMYWVNSEVSHIQKEIMENGPVVANMYIYTDFYSYKSGIYFVSVLGKLDVYASVKIIGWGEEDGFPYWLVVSTFGERFGDKGLFKIIRGKNEAYIEYVVNAASPKGKF